MSDSPYTGDTVRDRLPHAEIPGCTLVQDLIPLYLDGEVSPESHALIADHVQRCDRCSGYLAGARTVRSQILNEQRSIRAASAVNLTVEHVRAPVANSFGVRLWQALMGLLYLGGLFALFITAAEGEEDGVMISGIMLISAFAGLLIAGGARTKGWRVLMLLSGGTGMLVGLVSLADGVPNAEVFFFYSLGVVMLSIWGWRLHKKQQPPTQHQPSQPEQRLRFGAYRALLTAFLSVVGALMCGVAAIASAIFLIEGVQFGWPDQILVAGTITPLSIGGLLAINHYRRWFVLPPWQPRQLIGMGLLFFGVTLLLAVLPTGMILGNALLPSAIGVGLVFAGLSLWQRDRNGASGL